MLVHCLYQAIIDTLWDEVSRKSCFTRAREFANLSIVIVDLDVGLKGLGISMLVLFVDTIQGLVSFLTDLAILRLYQRDIVSMSQLHFLPLVIFHHWEDDIGIVQNLKGFTCRSKDFTRSC